MPWRLHSTIFIPLLPRFSSFFFSLSLSLPLFNVFQLHRRPYEHLCPRRTPLTNIRTGLYRLSNLIEFPIGGEYETVGKNSFFLVARCTIVPGELTRWIWCGCLVKLAASTEDDLARYHNGLEASQFHTKKKFACCTLSFPGLLSSYFFWIFIVLPIISLIFFLLPVA